ncbi:MAG TPA: MFS transporter, partial [Pseudomonadales bacterium]
MLALAIGVIGFSRVPAAPPDRVAAPKRLLHSVIEGGRTVFSSASMRMVMIQNVAMAMFFMGSYIVTMPLLVREVYAGSAQDLALMNGANSLGLVVTIVLLLRLGDVRRLGRALLLSQGIGALVLAGAAVAPSFSIWVLALFVWGTCGGIAMTMSRIVMQEQAPPAQRGRVMSFYSFSFMGAGPIGAVLNGYLVDVFGPQVTLMIASVSMLAVIVLVGMGSRLWWLEGHAHQVLNEAEARSAV